MCLPDVRSFEPLCTIFSVCRDRYYAPFSRSCWRLKTMLPVEHFCSFENPHAICLFVLLFLFFSQPPSPVVFLSFLTNTTQYVSHLLWNILDSFYFLLLLLFLFFYDYVLEKKTPIAVQEHKIKPRNIMDYIPIRICSVYGTSPGRNNMRHITS